MSIQATSDQNFDNDVINASGLVLVDFWATWCGPCRSLAPILEDVATLYAGKVKFLKLDVDNNPSSAQKFNIRGIPALLLFKNSQLIATKVGLLTKEELKQFIDQNS